MTDTADSKLVPQAYLSLAAAPSKLLSEVLFGNRGDKLPPPLFIQSSVRLPRAKMDPLLSLSLPRQGSSTDTTVSAAIRTSSFVLLESEVLRRGCHFCPRGAGVAC